MSNNALLTEEGLWMLAYVHKSINAGSCPQLGFSSSPFCLQKEYAFGYLNITCLLENFGVLIALIKDIFSAIVLTLLWSMCCLNKLIWITYLYAKSDCPYLIFIGHVQWLDFRWKFLFFSSVQHPHCWHQEQEHGSYNDSDSQVFEEYQCGHWLER